MTRLGQCPYLLLGLLDTGLGALHRAYHQRQIVLAARQREGAAVEPLPLLVDDGEGQFGLPPEGAVVAQHQAAAALGVAAEFDPLPQIERVDQVRITGQQQPVVILHHPDSLVHGRAGEAIGPHRLVEQLGIVGRQGPQGFCLKQLEHPVQLRPVEQTAQHELAAIEGLAGAVIGIKEAGHFLGAIVPLPG
ncbi:hypothetical protein D3C75_490170 [compost metagenome]